MILNRAVGGLRRTLWALLPVVWLATAAVLAWRLPDGSAALPAFAVAPAIGIDKKTMRGLAAATSVYSRPNFFIALGENEFAMTSALRAMSSTRSRAPCAFMSIETLFLLVLRTAK